MARGAPSPARLTACRLPMESVLRSSTTPSNSVSMISRTRSSRPGTPATSERLLSKSMRGSLLLEPGAHRGRQFLRALLLDGVAALRNQHERRVGELCHEPPRPVRGHDAVLL